MKLSLVILFYDEAGAARRVTRELAYALAEAKIPDFELICVDNGSRDDTRRELEEAAAAVGGAVRLLSLPANRGYGGGALAGLAGRRGEWVGFMAGDGQVEARDVARLARLAIDQGAPFAKVVRVGREDGPLRAAISRVYNACYGVLFGVRVRDVNATPKLLRRSLMEQLALSRADWLLDAELTAKAAALGVLPLELPIRFGRRSAGRSKLRPLHFLEFAARLARYRFSRDWRAWLSRTRTRSSNGNE